MPILHIYTTLARSQIPARFAANTAQLLGKVLNKPIKAMSVCVNCDQIIYSGLNPECGGPFSLATLRNIGKPSAAVNRTATEELSKHFERELGIKAVDSKFVFVEITADELGLRGQLRSDLV
ncbi:unnamed protein product [Medioppia subpectinata]|uniref:Macrophage migration inhibitory factor n=1 Tax=Medioppia subpectinata TaxID=1979941 RepID=A0A7R9Q8F5_9ACAR|nr:unnamed protein product [Medioppia subpectinata]CAG2116626.1 unnamed protein product [Medioppia subpectinata]